MAQPGGRVAAWTLFGGYWVDALALELELVPEGELRASDFELEVVRAWPGGVQDLAQRGPIAFDSPS